MDNPLTTKEEVDNEFADIRKDATIALLESAVARQNNQAVPQDVTDQLQMLAERLLRARVVRAEMRGEAPPARPDYLDPPA